MRGILSLPIPLIAGLAAVCHSAIASRVSGAELQSLLKENELVLAGFISPSFQASKDLEREFEIATKYSRSPLVTIDCTVDAAVCADNDVSSYPAIRLFRNGTAGPRYRGLRKASSIASFMIKERLPELSLVNADNIEAFRKVDDTVILGYFDPADDWLQELFAEVAGDRHKDFVFGMTTDAALAAAENLSVPSVVAYKRRDGDHKLLPGQFDKETLETFLLVATPLIIGEINKRTIHDYVGNAKPVAYIFTNNDEEAAAIRRELTPLARRYNSWISFGVIDAYEYGHMAQNLELEPDKFPAFVIHNILTDEVFPYDQSKEITREGVEKLIEDIKNGKAKSEGKFGEGVNVSDYEDEDEDEETAKTAKEQDKGKEDENQKVEEKAAKSDEKPSEKHDEL